MSTQTAPSPHSGREANASESFDLRARTVLLASDGSPSANAASRFAFALADRHGAVVNAISVMDTRSAPMPPPVDLAIAIADASVGDRVHDEQVDAVRVVIETAVGHAVDWPVRFALGTPAAVIVSEARRLRASLVIVGLRRHGPVDRVLQDETALAVMRRAACPVIGIASDMDGLPIRALAAIDFSRSSFVAARAASGVMGEGGRIVLAYAPPISFELSDDGEAFVHALGVEAAFACCRAEIGDRGATIDQVVLHRAVARPISAALLEYADATQCELISAGSARHGRLDRWLLGSVSTELVRDGRRSVLIVPPKPVRKAGGR